MSEYKENTVGYWLSQLKEPLKSRALGMGHASLGEYSPSLKEAVEHIYELGEYGERDEPFWTGVQKAFSGMQPVYGNLFLGDKGWEGYNMAKECAPDDWLKPKDDGEGKAIADSPKKTRELFFYADETLITPLRNPFKEPLVVSPRGEMNSVIVEEDKIKELMNANPSVTFWPTNVGGVSPAPKDSWQESQNMGIHSAIRNHPKLGEIQPERAVVGYEEPKPIDTIEKKHELRIKNLEAYNKYQAERNQQIMDLNPHVDFCDSEGNLIRPSRMTALEARVIQLEGVVGKLEQQIEYVYRNLPKDFDGTI